MFKTVNYWPDKFNGKYKVATESDTAYKVTLEDTTVYCINDDINQYVGKPIQEVSIHDFNVAEINKLKKPFDAERSASKTISFALQYQGTWLTLVQNSGFEPSEAKAIEQNYHTLYAVSRQWVESKIQDACINGYATVAFGLRIRTPMLSKVIWNSSSMPREAAKEARTLGNAISGQSYGLLNCRAANEFIERVRASKYANDIVLCMQIHDAIYGYVPNDVEAVKWFNDNLIDCMKFQDLPELEHPQIKISSELDIHYPNWSYALTIPNDSSVETIQTLASKHIYENI